VAGSLDDVRSYTRALSADDIAELQNPLETLKGDFNLDTVVDLVDFGILRDHMAAHLDGAVGYPEGDINFDSKIDLDDFVEFKGLYPGVVAAAVGVPEPSTLALGLGALAGIAAGLRCRFVRARHIEN
jgi:hypothetical protein